MTRNDRNAANAPVPAWLGWKRNILYAALAALVSAVFIYQLTRPHSLLGGILGWELEQIDDASREGIAAQPGAVTWAGLFAQLERKKPSLPDARPRAGTAQLIAAVEAVQRGKISAADAAERLAPAEDAATFNLVARLAYAWIRDRATPPNSPDPIARFHALAAIVDAQPPATASTLYNDTLHDAWREVLKTTAIRRQDVIASCARNYRHFDIREHYAALPTIHATLTALARDLHTAGHLAQAETLRQWLDRAYLGLIDNERDYATRLLAAELLTDIRAEDFYAAAPNHHRPNNLREAFHRQAADCNADLVDLFKLPMIKPDTSDPAYSLLAFALGATATMAGVIVGLVIQLLAKLLQSRLASMMHHRDDDEKHGPVSHASTRHPHILELWILPFFLSTLLPGLALLSPFLAGHAGSAEGFLIRLAALAGIGAIVTFVMAAWQHRINWKSSLLVGAASLLPIAVLITLEPDWGFWPTLRSLDIGFGAAPIIGVVLLLLIIACIVLIALPLRIGFAVGVRFWLMIAIVTHMGSLSQQMKDRQYQAAVTDDHYDEINARLGPDWKSLLPPAVDYTTNVPTPVSTRSAP